MQVLKFEPDVDSVLRGVLLDGQREGAEGEAEAARVGLQSHLYRALDDNPRDEGQYMEEGSELLLGEYGGSSTRPRGPGGFTKEAVLMMQVCGVLEWATP